MYRRKWSFTTCLYREGSERDPPAGRKGRVECSLTESLLLFLEFPNLQKFDGFSSRPFLFKAPRVCFLVSVAQGDMAVV